MPYVANDVLEVKFFSRVATTSTVGINIRHYRLTGQIGAGATETVAANQFAAAFAPQLRACMCQLARYQGVSVRRVHPTIGATFLSSNSAGDGTSGASLVPPQVAGLLSLRTAFGGRRFRGRMYVPFPSTSDILPDGTPTLAYLANLTTLGIGVGTTLLIGELVDTVEAQPAIFHRPPRPPGIDPSNNIVNVITSNRVGTIRRRGAFRGPDANPPV